MNVYVATGDSVLVLNLIAVAGTDVRDLSPEDFKKDCRETLLGTIPGATHVWFEDECGTALDPVTGPNPVYGPVAEDTVQQKWDKDYNNPLEKYGMN